MIRPYRRLFAMVTASMYFTILAGCGGGDSSPTQPSTPTPTPEPPAPPTPVATSITITPSSHTLTMINATVQLSATVRDQNNNPMTGPIDVTWTSSNTTVAPVNTNGLVRALANGTAQITARSGNASGTASITVAEPVPTRITISPTPHTLAAIGATVQLSATVRDQRNNVMSGQPITWSSGDEAVATVSGDGLVTAVSNGMTEITAKSGNPSATAEITVAQTPASISIAVDPETTTLTEIDQTLQLMAAVSDANDAAIEGAEITWSSSDESVATVNEEGLVTAVGNGMADVTATSGELSDMVSVTVIDPSVPVATSITIEPDSPTLEESGQTEQLAATVLDQNGNEMTDVTVTWSSSDEAVVTVDEDGLVTAVGNGMADVVAMAGDASGMAGVTVSIPVDDVTYVEWVGVTVERGKLFFKSGAFEIPLTTCLTENPTIGLVAPFPPEGVKDWFNSVTEDTLTVHYSVWQRSVDMGGTWNDIEDTWVEYDACPYDPDVAGEYRLVGDITLNGERESRASENTFIVP